MTDVAKKLELADAEVARLSNIITIQQKQIERLIECRDAAQTYLKQVEELKSEVEKAKADRNRIGVEIRSEFLTKLTERDQTIRSLQDRIRQLEDELVN